MHYSIHQLRLLRLTIGQNIHAIRVERKMPLRRLAERSGLPETLLDYFELGKREIGLRHLLRIAIALEVDMQQLMTPPPRSAIG